MLYIDLKLILVEVRELFPTLVFDCTKDGSSVVIRQKYLSSAGPSEIPMYNPRLCLSLPANAKEVIESGLVHHGGIDKINSY